MSKLGDRRRKMGYETNIPRCGTCINFKKPYVFLSTNSIPKQSPAFCKIGDFTVQPNAICNSWMDADGTTLEKEKI